MGMRRSFVGLVVGAMTLTAFGLGYVAGQGADDTQVPNLLGSGTENGGQAAAREALTEAGLRLGRVGRSYCAPDEHGLVVRQTPSIGKTVPVDSTVNIVIGDDGTHLIGLSGTADPCLPGEQNPAGQPPRK